MEPTISIHTLAWRVTVRRLLIVTAVAISIHTLAWRVTDARVSDKG